MDEDISAVISGLYRSNFGKMVGLLMYHTGIKDITLAEDIVQEAFTIAAEKWPATLPLQPEAWLYKTVRNLAYNSLRKEKRQAIVENEFILVGDTSAEEGYLLKLMFSGIQSSFSPKIQLIVALRYVGGLQVKRIAALLATDEDGISKILYRWRAQSNLHSKHFQNELPVHDEAKVNMVLKILYVTFTEGYQLSDNGQLKDEKLCENALSLVKDILQANITANGKTNALYALMLYHLARAGSRLNHCNELVLLADQDRSLWNKDMIAVAHSYLLKSQKESTAVNSYQIEAAIAYIHVSSATSSTTDWLKIAALYEQLKTFNPSPFTLLNQAVALYFGKETTRSIYLLNTLNAHTFFQNHHLLHCFWGLIYSDQRDYVKAMHAYQKALTCPVNVYEQKFITGKLLAMTRMQAG